MTDKELVEKAEALGVSPGHLRVLKEVVLDPRENRLDLSNGRRERWLGEILFPHVDNPDFLVVSVTPKYSGTGYGFWSVVADKDGRALCRIDHVGGLDIRKIWREGEFLCIKYDEFGSKCMKLPVFGLQTGGEGQRPIRFDTDASGDVIRGEGVECLCFDEDEGPVLTSRTTRTVSPGGAFTAVEESLFEKEKGTPVGYVLSVEDSQTGDTVAYLGRGYRKCTYVWLVYKDWEILLIKQHESLYRFNLHAVALNGSGMFVLPMPETRLESTSLNYTLEVDEAGILRMNSFATDGGKTSVIELSLDALLEAAASEEDGGENEEED